MSEPEALVTLRENFAFLDTWEDRYRFLVDLGRELPPMDDALKTPATKVDGCLSQVWMLGRSDPSGALSYLADSDAAIVRGLIAVLLTACNGRLPADILASDVDRLFDELGLAQHISMNRRNGFFAMVQRIRSEAARLSAAN
jgi:cysteine desulfuration protein SufE